jgi:hypothetical protein
MRRGAIRTMPARADRARLTPTDGDRPTYRVLVISVAVSEMAAVLMTSPGPWICALMIWTLVFSSAKLFGSYLVYCTTTVDRQKNCTPPKCPN